MYRLISALRVNVRVRVAVIAVASALGLSAPVRPTPTRRSVYVDPAGLGTHNGSKGRPISLASALSAKGPVRPGDTVWLRGGIYRGNFTSELIGTPSLPIIVRAYPGECVTLDGAASPALPTLLVRGASTTYWGFEITNSDAARAGGVASRGTGLDIYGPRTRFVNLVIHDAQNGVGFWSTAVDSELYGNIIYNNGVDSSDRGHGHSIYAQNRTGTKRIDDNILFNSFSHGIHIYTEGGFIDNFMLDGNVLFNHGVLSGVSGPQPDILVGGRRIAHNLTVTNNFLFDSPDLRGGGAEFWHTLPCINATIEHNYFVSSHPISLNCVDVRFNGNNVYGSVDRAFAADYPANSFHTTKPSSPWTFVRPNRYDPSRGHVIVYNWTLQGKVDVDMTAMGWPVGTRIQIFDAERYTMGPLLSTTYEGTPVGIPMTGLSVERPVGGPVRTPSHTAPSFGVFVVVATAVGRPIT